jgi:hypothetical protein
MKRRRPKFVRIPLHGTRGKNSYAIIDAANLLLVAPHRWFLSKSPTSDMCYAIRTGIKKGGKYTTVYMHAVVRPDLKKIDHRNRNGLDNRRKNLRRASEGQNQMNRGLPKNNTSGFKGVSHVKRNGKWRAHIRRSALFYLGDFPTAREAALAYDAAARKHCGRFARFNFPRRGERSVR